LTEVYKILEFTVTPVAKINNVGLP
jgi:hypothetical protein